LFDFGVGWEWKEGDRIGGKVEHWLFFGCGFECSNKISVGLNVFCDDVEGSSERLTAFRCRAGAGAVGGDFGRVVVLGPTEADGSAKVGPGGELMLEHVGFGCIVEDGVGLVE